jgi:hypothetical protein
MRLPLLLWFALTSLALTADDYLPLAEGHEWIMDMTMTLPSGEAKTSTARRKVGATQEVKGKLYHRVVLSIERQNAVEDANWFRKDATGFYSLDPKDPEASEEVEVLFPLEVGKTWLRNTGPKKVTNTVVALESVTIGGKTYDKCYHIRTTSADGFTEDFWLAPEVGNVKSVIVFGNDRKVTLTLREFEAAK